MYILLYNVLISDKINFQVCLEHILRKYLRQSVNSALQNNNKDKITTTL